MKLILLVLLGAIFFSAVAVPAAATGSPFVTRDGTQLLLGGRPFQFTGLNVYNANSQGLCWHAMNSGSALEDALTAIGPGKVAMRAWFFQPLATTAGERDWTAFDHTLAVARAHRVRVIATLSDQWGECGDGGVNGFKPRDWYISGYTKTDPGLLVPYRDWVAEVVSRYKDSATIFAWQLMNEAEVSEVDVACPPGPEPADILKAWATDVSSLVKSLDPNHLVSLGTGGGGQCGAQGSQYQDVHDISTIDLCEYHDYTPNVAMPGDQWNGLQVRIDQCNALNKPIFVGEVGIRPSDVGGTYQSRADALAAKLDAQRAAGVRGFLAWAWSNLGSTLDNYDIGPGDPVLDVLTLEEGVGGTAQLPEAASTPLERDSEPLRNVPLSAALAAGGAAALGGVVWFTRRRRR